MIKRNIFSIITACVILYLSLAPPDDFDKVHINIPYFDKLVHAGMYFALMTAIAVENRNTITGVRHLAVAALAAFLYGVLMEILQLLTAYRSASAGDAAADLSGILMAAAFFIMLRKHNKV